MASDPLMTKTRLYLPPAWSGDVMGKEQLCHELERIAPETKDGYPVATLASAILKEQKRAAT